ncbi:MAG TPA: cyclic nucleotide-binding domain-containing protein [Thermoplasmata archaeon]|jgi:CRP/FNR family cyclic AMP-dependent transcriptional regulator|nr:cyclic nucleotide-binding domain-containing protein [Thermoplasmata archaeon]
MSAEDSEEPELRLADHRFFRGMDPEFLGRLGEKTYVRTFEAGALIVREGDPADEFLALFSGKVALEIIVADRPRTTVQTLGAGDVLGWSWLFPPHQWRVDARAVKVTRALGLAAAPLRDLLEERPADGYVFLMRLLPVIAQRLENTRLQLLDLHGR